MTQQQSSAAPLLFGVSQQRVVLIVSYIATFSLYTLIIKATQTKTGRYTFNFTVVVLLTEVLKFFFSTVMYWATSQQQQQQDHHLHKAQAATFYLLPYWYLYSIPALLYFVFNNLVFINLHQMHYEAFKLFGNTRIIFSGILGYYFLNQKLSIQQWCALVLIFFGCVVLDFDATAHVTISKSIMMLFQVGMASIASLLIEMLLKRNADHDINLQNMILYAFSIIFNVLFLGSEVLEQVDDTSHLLRDVRKPLVHVLATVSALCGIITNRVLKELSATTKAFVLACEIICTTFVASYVFDATLTPLFLISLICMLFSVVLYSYYAVPSTVVPTTLITITTDKKDAHII